MSRLPYRLLESREIYRGHVRFVKDRFSMHVAPKKIVTRELVHHPGVVVIVPYVDKKHILLERQFRYAVKGDLWEIPAGTMEKGEKHLNCAKRELEEETGYRARNWKYLTRFYPAPGLSNELMVLFSARDLYPGKLNLDHDEFIQTKIVSIEKARQMIRQGKIRDAKTIVGILWPALG